MDKVILRNPWFWGVAVLFATLFSLTVAIFFIEIAEGEGFGGAARTTGPWVGGLVGLVIATLTAMYVVATQAMAKATAQLADETKRAREESSAPLITTYLEFQRRLLFITIENIGGGIARNVRATLQPPIPSRDGPITELPVTSHNIPSLRPQEKFPHFIDAAPKFFSERGKPSIYTATVTYDDIDGNPREPLEYPINISVYEKMLGPGKDMADLVKEVEQIRRRLDGITDLSSLHIKTPRDVEREYQEALQRIEEQRTEQQESESQEEKSQPDP